MFLAHTASFTFKKNHKHNHVKHPKPPSGMSSLTLILR